VYFRNNYVSILLEEGVFSSQVRNLTVYVDEKVDENTYLGILVYDNRKPEKPKVITAQKGKLIRQDSEVWFELYHGSHQDKNIKAGQISLLYFDKYSLNLNFFDEDYIRSIEANERYVHELFNLRNVDKTQKNKLLSHGHFRISWPLNALALVSLAAAVMIAGRYHRKDRLYRNITLGFVGCGVLVIYILFNNLSLYNPYIAIFMYLTPLSVMVSSMIYLRGSRLKLEKK
jgi:lipopolysaccharide export system permease protein